MEVNYMPGITVPLPSGVRSAVDKFELLDLLQSYDFDLPLAYVAYRHSGDVLRDDGDGAG